MLKVRGLSLDRFAAFLAIADAGGLARAAPGEPVRQSQLSRQLKDLETALAQPLFVRTGKGLTLTPAGVTLSGLVRTLGQGLDDIAAVERGPVRVSLAAGDSVLQWVVLPKLALLEESLVGIDLAVEAAGADGTVTALLEHRVDLGLLRTTETTDALKTVRLGRVEYAVFHRIGAPPRPLAVPTTERGLDAALTGPVGLRCETFPQVAQAVRSGRFCGVLPTFARSVLPAAEFRMQHTAALDRVGAPLLLAWRPRTLELRPQVKRLRHALELLVRQAL
jgi:DNA-binding transcriptional LysR family regulator